MYQSFCNTDNVIYDMISAKFCFVLDKWVCLFLTIPWLDLDILIKSLQQLFEDR